MIRKAEERDLDTIMQIWRSANLDAHSFIPAHYWLDRYEEVKAAIPLAEVYVHETDDDPDINGFIGLNGDYVEGLFVESSVRSRGIGAKLLNFAKRERSTLSLCVYAKNARAVRFYLREQFTVQAERFDACTGEKEFRMDWRKNGSL